VRARAVRARATTRVKMRRPQVSRRLPTSAGLAATLVFLAAVFAQAETDVFANGVVRGKYLYNTDDEIEASAADARVELDIGVGDFTIGGVYRAYQLSDSSYNPAGIDVPAAAVKHRYAAFERDDTYLRAGHFVTTFGHGLTLRSYEDVDLEYDTLLDGLVAEYSLGPFALTGLTGTIDEEASGTRFYTHVVRGARAAMPVASWAEVAGSVVERSSTWNDVGGQVDSDYSRFEDGVMGGELSVWAGPLTIAAEYADRSGEHPDIEGDDMTGHATYASAVLAIDWLTLLAEFKDYERFQHYLVNPPTCVREHLFTLMNRATYQPDLNDERGFIVEGSVPVGDAVYLTAGASEARSHDDDLRHWEMFGHGSYTPGELTLGLAASMSREYLFGSEGWTSKFTEHRIGAVEAAFPVLADHSLEVTVEGQSVEEPSGETYEDYVVAVAWYAGLDLTVTAAAEGTTQELGRPDARADGEARDRWTMISVKRSFPGDLEVELSAGTERGGKKCTGGVCYFEPEFEGVRLRFSKFF
jgi:hypothetical protein